MQRIKKAYAENGDLKIIPETPPLDGSENWEQGRGAYYELDNDPNTGDPLALDIDREQDNYFKNVISKNIKHWQENSYPIWFSDIKYPKNAIVKYTDGNTYVSKVDNNTALPTNTINWTIYDPSSLDDIISNIQTLPIGAILNGYTIFDNCIVAFGGEFNRAEYPKLWAYLQANPSLVKTQAQWQSEATANGGICGFFGDGDGTTTFRVPNLDKAFLRPDIRGVGSYQGDELKSHSHTVRQNFVNFSSNGKVYTVENGNSEQFPISGGGNETRPKNIAVLPLIVAK